MSSFQFFSGGIPVNNGGRNHKKMIVATEKDLQKTIFQKKLFNLITKLPREENFHPVKKTCTCSTIH